MTQWKPQNGVFYFYFAFYFTTTFSSRHQESLKTYHRGRIDVAMCIKDDLSIITNVQLVTTLCEGIQKFLINATSNFQYNYLAWENPGIGRYLVFLTMEGFIFFGIVMMIEYRVLGNFFKSCLSSTKRLVTRCLELSPVVVVSKGNNGFYDSDVVNEKVRIDNQPVNNHVLMLKDLTKTFHPRTGTFCHKHLFQSLWRDGLDKFGLTVQPLQLDVRHIFLGYLLRWLHN